MRAEAGWRGAERLCVRAALPAGARSRVPVCNLSQTHALQRLKVISRCTEKECGRPHLVT